MKDKKAWNDVVQKTNNPRKFVAVEEEKMEKKKRLWLHYALSYLLNTYKQNIIY